jgi:hypothetical protein
MSEHPLVLDLFSGTGSATQPFVECGKHRVVRVDIAGHPDVRADVRRLPISGPVEGIWASPPCTEFSTMKRCAWASGRGSKPDPEGKGMELVRATWKVVQDLNPEWWILENVAGADPFIGPPVMKAGAWHLWGNFPYFLLPQSNRMMKGRPGDAHLNRFPGHGATKSAASAVIPRPLAEAIHRAVCPKGSP